MLIKTLKKTTLILFLLGIVVCNLFTQECIEYPDIEGANCENCVPSGWTMEVPSPGIVDPDGNWGGVGCILNVDGESPGGGNMALMGGVPSFFESISTTVTGLDPAITYSFGLYWHYSLFCETSFTFEPAELILTIDGEEFTFSGSEEWELVELCIQPSSSSLEIIITGFPTVNSGVILVDTAPCEDLSPCCLLAVGITDEEVDLCAGEDYVMPAFYDNDNGSVTIEWTSDPTEGVNYLNETDIIDPTFNFPFSENHDGGTFEFTVTVEDDDCIKNKKIIINVIPNEVPEFDIEPCELSEPDVFYSPSDNGYTGTWSGDFDFEGLAGSVEPYTFTIDSDQNNCLEFYEYQIFIEPVIDLSFIIPLTYCELDSETYQLPERSDENVKGEWDVDQFIPSDFPVGEYEFIFTPNDEYCAYPFILEIEILKSDNVSFNIQDVFCVTDQDFELPTESIDGFFGTWNEAYIDLSNPIQNETYIFTPDISFDCIEPYSKTITVIETIISTFDIPDTICRQHDVLIFDDTSIEGEVGSWFPLAIDPSTVIGDRFDIEWTPFDDSNECLIEINKTIIIQEPLIIDLELPESICRNDDVFILPTIDTLGGISGDWNISQFDPDTIAGSEVNLTFTPSEGCVDTFVTSINIIDNNDPQFSLETEFCSSDDDFTLPSISDNGISGTWSITEIQPSLIIDEITSVFMPADQNGCFNSIEVIFSVSNLITPLFDLPEAFCEDDELFNFSETSINGVDGSWTISEFDASIFAGNEFENDFIPNDISCNEMISISIPVLSFMSLQNMVTSASSCSANDGSIIFNSSIDLEYSIDNGLTWQANPNFENLGSGNYTITARHISFTNCFQSYDIQLTAPSAPIITMIEVISISDCGASDGMVTCIAEGSNLEFSIDNGTTWQSSNTFNNLAVDNYIILVRSDGDSNCSTQQSFVVEDIQDIDILDILISNITDCDLSDGEIVVFPDEVFLEYSIDDINWQSENIFSNLEEGEYSVSIRLTISPNCINSKLVDIFAPTPPEIINVVNINPSDCGTQDGSITIEANGLNIEFSIDGGNTWSTNNLFSDIPSGTYIIRIREINTSNCIDQTTTVLETPNTPEIINSEITPPSDCISNNGSIFVNTSINDVEFSIDNGVTWQDSGTFENLNPQNYSVIVRNKISPDCTTSIPFEIIEVPCPCNDLNLEINTVDINCFNPISGIIEIVDITGFYTNDNFEIIWSTGSDDLELTDLASGWYTYEIQYDKNCTLRDSVFLDSFDPIDFALLAFDPNCEQGGSIEVTELEGGAGQFQYSLDNINFQDDNVFFNLSADEYEVFIEDNFDCSESRDIVLNPNNNLSLEIPEIQPIVSGESVTLNPLINQTTIDSFEWSPISGILNPNELVAVVSPNQTTEYTLTIFFGDCIETRTITVEVIENNDLYIGNTFSPNFDGNNDFLFIQSANENTILEFTIFDRWGNKVFTKINPEVNKEDDGWNGAYNDQEVSVGVYPYLVKYLVNSEEKIIIGHVTLIR